ncbi:MAG: flagellar M-ring protein FliF [Campylobacteraceae bacterium]|nr:flagellar M-ring protein FliF [Campylobacteraceae bacterium]
MDQLFKFVNNLNAAQRAVIIGGFSLLFVLLVGLLVYSNLKAQDEKLNYIIASNLTKSQVLLASSELETSGVPFSVIGSGNNLTLKTSKQFINIAKIKLITSDAATSQHTGWEIFEKSSLGTTNFENKVKYLRALEGELSRSLESLSGVLRASVKIAIPKDTIFTQRKIKTTASAVLTVKPGVFLTQKQIDGIKNFIASAVSNLKAENIKLIDQDGSLLEHSVDDIDNMKFSKQNKYKKKIEQEYETKIISLLEPIIGQDRVVARVTVDLSYVKQEIQEEIFDPEGTIRSQQTSESSSTGSNNESQSGGIVGVQSNIEDTGSSANSGSSNNSSESTKNTTNYEISKKIINQKDNAYATIKKISAAVTFDSTVLKDLQNKEEFLASVKEIVQDAVGFVDKRGDKITVKDFIFLSAKSSAVTTTTVNEAGERVEIVSSDDGTDSVALIKSIIRDFGEYIQYLIAAVLLFVFYKKFIANHEVVILSDTVKAKKTGSADEEVDMSFLDEFAHEFDTGTAHGRLKAKIKSQIMNNIEGLDEEGAAKYEVLIEELDKEINDSPHEIANMLELLLAEGDSKFKKK